MKKLIGDKGSILKESDYIEYDLQNPINKEQIKDSKAEKILLGLSPYGKEEGIEYFDIVLEQLNSKNIKKIEKNEWDEIYNKIKEKNKRKIEKEIDKRFEQIKENNEKFEFDRKNMINIKKLEKDKEKKMLNLTYGMAPFNKEENAIFTALEICVSSGKPEILKRLIERIQSKENLIELFNIESDNKFKLSYDIYRKTTRRQTSKYYEIKNGDNIYKTVEKCVNKLIEMSKNNELIREKLEVNKFEKIVAVEKDIEEEEVKNNIGITRWKENIDFNLQTYLRFIEYIPYSEIINDNIEESAEKQKERIFKILDEAIENQIKKAKEIEKELLK